VGKRSESIDIDDSLNGVDLLKSISNAHGKKFNDFVFDSKGELTKGITFAINGVSIQKPILSRTKCRNISEFVILPPISGGSEPVDAIPVC
jgi:hypothetical protein